MLLLDAFKGQVNESKNQELENLTGGILGACHYCSTCYSLDSQPHDTSQHPWWERIFM